MFFDFSKTHNSVCVQVCVCVCGLPLESRGFFILSFFERRQIVWGVSWCEFRAFALHAKNRQRTVPVWTYVNLCENRRLEVEAGRSKAHWSFWKFEVKRVVSQKKGTGRDEPRWVWIAMLAKTARGQSDVRDWTSSGEDDHQRWVSIFGSCLGFSRKFLR